MTAAALQTQPRLLPDLQGTVTPHRDGRYRVLTIEHVPFDAFPEYVDGGPATVALDSWGVSYTSPAAADDRRYELHVYRCDTRERHPLCGTRHETMRDASRAAYEAGALGYMVYEADRLASEGSRQRRPMTPR